MQKKLRKEHGKKASEEDEDDNCNTKDNPITSCFELKLDFVCDNIFDDNVKDYPRTGHLFQQILVPGKTRKKKDIEIMTVVSIVLVSKKKVEKKKAKSTPVKRDIYSLIQDLESDDDDERMRTPRETHDDMDNDSIY